MRKLLVAVALLVITVSNAQKGSMLLGGFVGYDSAKIGDSKTENFEFTPKVGYQFADKWTAGVEGSVLTSKTAKNEKTTKNEDYKAGGFVRYSTPLSETFAVYADLGAGYQNTTLNDGDGVYASLTPALFINMKKGFGLNFSIGGINYDNLKDKNNVKEERYGFNFGKNFTVGISKNFGL